MEKTVSHFILGMTICATIDTLFSLIARKGDEKKRNYSRSIFFMLWWGGIVASCAIDMSMFF